MKTELTPRAIFPDPKTASEAAASPGEDHEYTMEELMAEFADVPECKPEPKLVRPLGVGRAIRTDDFNPKAEAAARAKLAAQGFDAQYWKILEECSHTGSAVATHCVNLRCNDKSWDERICEIDSAKHFILASNYTIGADVRGLAFLDALIRAAQRGVKILTTQTWLTSEIANRFVLGNKDNYEAYQRKLADLESYGSFSTYHGTIGATLKEGFHGNHFKALCIDGERTLVDGRNVVGFHFDPKVDMGDMGMVLSGPIALNMAREALRVITSVPLAGNDYTVVQDRPRWLEETKDEIGRMMAKVAAKHGAELEQMPAAMRDNLPRFYPIVWDPTYDTKKAVNQENRISRAMLETISRAKKEIILTQNYLNPPEEFLKALTEAAQRGVKVKVLTTGQVDSGLSVWPYITACTNYKEFITSGTEVYETAGLPEHSKILVVDDAIAAFGSFNVEIAAHKSLVECMMFTASPDLVLLNKAAAIDSLMVSRRIDQAELERMNVPGKFRLFDRVMAKITKPLL